MKLNKSQIAWVMDDFVNSVFYLMIPTILFSLYFREVVASGARSPDLLGSVALSIPRIMFDLHYLQKFLLVHSIL